MKQVTLAAGNILTAPKSAAVHHRKALPGSLCPKCSQPKLPRKDGHLVCLPCQSATALASGAARKQKIINCIKAGLPLPVFGKSGKSIQWAVDAEAEAHGVKNAPVPVKKAIEIEPVLTSEETFGEAWERNSVTRCIRSLNPNALKGIRLKAGESLYIYAV